MAESSDSIAPSIAIANAGAINSRMRSSVISGHCQRGKPCGMPPKAEPMVATPPKSKIACSVVAATSASSGPGTRSSGRTRGPKIAIARDSSPISVVAGCRSGSARSSCHSFW